MNLEGIVAVLTMLVAITYFMGSFGAKQVINFVKTEVNSYDIKGVSGLIICLFLLGAVFSYYLQINNVLIITHLEILDLACLFINGFIFVKYSDKLRIKSEEVLAETSEYIPEKSSTVIEKIFTTLKLIMISISGLVCGYHAFIISKNSKDISFILFTIMIITALYYTCVLAYSFIAAYYALFHARKVRLYFKNIFDSYENNNNSSCNKEYIDGYLIAEDKEHYIIKIDKGSAKFINKDLVKIKSFFPKNK